MIGEKVNHVCKKNCMICVVRVESRIIMDAFPLDVLKKVVEITRFLCKGVRFIGIYFFS